MVRLFLLVLALGVSGCLEMPELFPEHDEPSTDEATSDDSPSGAAVDTADNETVPPGASDGQAITEPVAPGDEADSTGEPGAASPGPSEPSATDAPDVPVADEPDAPIIDDLPIGELAADITQVVPKPVALPVL